MHKIYIKSYIRGLVPNVTKAVLLNISLTYPYDYLNERLNILFGGNIICKNYYNLFFI
jgi:hypothetical protein